MTVWKLLWIGPLLYLIAASGHADAVRLETSARVEPLEADWLRLMHYRGQNGQPPTESSITSPDFFLSRQGPSDPQAEFAAQLKAWRQETVTIGHDTLDPLCAFPARARWFRRHIDPRLPERPCPDLVRWKAKLNFQSLSLVYSSAYAGNAASMFGHNLLKLNLEQAAALGAPEEGLSLLDYGIGFVAVTNPDDVFTYAIKGLTGGYPGVFTLEPYYELVNTYAYAENRDLWELTIALSADEKELFLEHLWELLSRASTPYYFTHVNCSSMLVELLDVVKPSWRLTEQLHGFILPAVVMQRVAEHVPAAPLEFRPSQRRLFQTRFDALAAREQKELQRLWAGDIDPQSISDAAVLDTALDRITIEKSRLSLPEQSDLRAYETSVLYARSNLPGVSESRETVRATNNPILAHSSQRMGIEMGRTASDFTPGLRWRYGLHDLLDPPAGFDPYYQLNYIDVRAAASRRRTVADLSIAEVWSLAPFHLEDPVKSWTLDGGLHYVADQPSEDEIAADAGLHGYFRGSIGASWELWRERSLLSLLPGVQLQTGGRPLVDLGVTGLWLHRWNSRWQSLLSIRPAWLVTAQEKRHDEESLVLRYTTARHDQWELAWTQSEQSSLKIAWLIYY